MSDKTLSLEDQLVQHGHNDIQSHQATRPHHPTLAISWARHQDEIEEAHWYDLDQLPEVPMVATLSGQVIQYIAKGGR